MTLPVGEIICGDCLDVMREWPAGCVDAVITDPPYGQGAGKMNALRGMAGHMAINRDYGGFTWDASRPSPEYFAEMLRVSKVQAIFGGNFFADLLPPTRCWVCWYKGRRNDHADCEMLWTNLDKPARMLNYYFDGCMQGDRREIGTGRMHPTQKPLAVMEWLVERFTQPGDLILDPFCGSGSTLVAAERLGRRWIGIDIDTHWCDVARRRTAQRGLFQAAIDAATPEGE
jgi:site-specific DNA-methyltransferase (adenine-specific)